mgnify:CR=1 FL=1
MKRFAILTIILAGFAAVAFAGGPKEPGVMMHSTELFKYDKTQPLNAEIEVMTENAMRTQYLVQYNSNNGERVAAYYYVPARGKKPLPCVIVLHGSGGSKKDFEVIYEYFVTRGFAVLAPDTAFHGDRQIESFDVFGADWYQYRNMIVQTVVDLQRGVDWLNTRSEIHPDRIGYFGISQGSFIGSVFCAIEKRIRAVILMIGGADYDVILRHSEVPNVSVMRNLGDDAQLDEVARTLQPIDPKNYVGAISPRPVLLMNGEKDQLISLEGGKRMQELANEPKEQVWYDGGHIPPFDRILVTGLDFLKKNLKRRKPTGPKPDPEPVMDYEPQISVKIDADISNPDQRFFTVRASTAKPLPEGAKLAIRFFQLAYVDFPIHDDGTNGDTKAGDGEWAMKFEFGPECRELNLVGGVKYFTFTIRAITASGKLLSESEPVALFPEE